MKIELKILVDLDRLRGLLVSAQEGGSNYWIEYWDYILPEGIVYEDFRKKGVYVMPGEYWNPYQLIPFIPGCKLIVKELEPHKPEHDGKYELDLEKMVNGLQLMAEKYPWHYADFAKEDDDCITADVWLQLSIFGELIYG